MSISRQIRSYLCETAVSMSTFEFLNSVRETLESELIETVEYTDYLEVRRIVEEVALVRFKAELTDMLNSVENKLLEEGVIVTIRKSKEG